MNAKTVVEQLGGIAAVARICGVKPPSVHEWVTRGIVPADRCEAIEAATGGAVTCEQLRPDLDWTRVGGRAFYRARQLPTREAA